MKKWKKELIAAIALVTALVLLCYGAADKLIPPRYQYGSNWETYLSEDENSIQVLFCGSSMSYCNVIPAVIYENSKISSYGIAGPEQTIAMSFYYIKEAVKTQKPQAVFLEASGMFFKRSESYSKVNIGYMPWGINRIAAAMNAADPKERTGLLFPLYNYHDRWDEYPEIREENREMVKEDLAGYTYLDTSAQIEQQHSWPASFDERSFEENARWLRKISDFCTRRGIKLVLYTAPNMVIISDEHKQMLIDAIPQGVEYCDLSGINDVIGIDCTRDFYDAQHLNVYGAEKFSAYLAQWMTELGIVPGQCDLQLWQERADSFRQRMAG